MPRRRSRDQAFRGIEQGRCRVGLEPASESGMLRTRIFIDTTASISKSRAWVRADLPASGGRHCLPRRSASCTALLHGNVPADPAPRGRQSGQPAASARSSASKCRQPGLRGIFMNDRVLAMVTDGVQPLAQRTLIRRPTSLTSAKRQVITRRGPRGSNRSPLGLTP